MSYFSVLAVLLLLHTTVSYGVYRAFTKTARFDPPVQVEPSFVSAGSSVSFMTKRTVTPLPVYFYIVGGYGGLAVACLFGIYPHLKT